MLEDGGGGGELGKRRKGGEGHGDLLPHLPVPLPLPPLVVPGSDARDSLHLGVFLSPPPPPSTSEPALVTGWLAKRFARFDVEYRHLCAVTL